MEKLNFFEKFFLARLERKLSRTSGAVVTGIPGGVVWPDRDYENFAKETYMKNVIAFRCISIIARSAASVPWKLFKHIDEKKQEAVEGHYINAVLKRPNPRESFTTLVESIISYLGMAGNSFVEKVSLSAGMNGGEIRELYSLRPDRFKINTDKEGQISGYTYHVNGTEVKYDVDLITGRCDILHLKTFHPLDDFWGMSPTEPAAVSVDTHNSSNMWNKNLIENEARPGLIYIFDGSIGDKEYKRLSNLLKTTREGSDNVGKSMIVEGKVKDVKPYGFSPTEMDWLKSNLELARNICNIWGVPPQIVGIPDTNTYSNYQEARQAFWEETVMFYLCLLKDEFNHWFFSDQVKDQGLFVNFLLDNVPAFAAKRDKVWERVEKASFLKVNEKREAVEYEEAEGGDVILVPATMLPLGMESETNTDEKDEQAVQKLIEQGYTREEAEMALGLLTEETK